MPILDRIFFCGSNNDGGEHFVAARKRCLSRREAGASVGGPWPQVLSD
jgi:hypothetical protein